MINEGNIQKEKDLESARKRVAERELREMTEKKHKIKKSENDNINKK